MMLKYKEDIIRLGGEANVELISYENYNSWLTGYMDSRGQDTVLGLVKEGMTVETLRMIEDNFKKSYSAIILDGRTEKLYYLTYDDIEVIVEDVEASNDPDSILEYLCAHCSCMIDVKNSLRRLI